MHGIDRIFFGVFIVIVIAAIAGYALSNTNFGGAPRPQTRIVAVAPAVIAATPAKSDLCQCFDQAFALAGSGADVTSAQYRTGFEQCYAQYKSDGADAWTAGWNARLSARPFEATCRSFLSNRR